MPQVLLLVFGDPHQAGALRRGLEQDFPGPRGTEPRVPVVRPARPTGALFALFASGMLHGAIPRTPPIGSPMLACLLAVTLAVAPPNSITSHQATTHAMRYHVALPTGWNAGRSWPVVIVIADAHRDFKTNLARFMAARGDRPFILVAPEVTTCGGTGGQLSPPYSYTDEEWKSARAPNDHDFDDAGLAAVLADVQKQWNGEPKAYLTGWEAGGHTVWAQTLRRPERWRAVAPVSTNYQGRGVSAEQFSKAPERTTLPVQVFWFGRPDPELAQASANLRQQTDRAIADARAHGFSPRPIRVVPDTGHGPLPEAVLAWFDSLETARRKPAPSH